MQALVEERVKIKVISNIKLETQLVQHLVPMDHDMIESLLPPCLTRLVGEVVLIVIYNIPLYLQQMMKILKSFVT